MSEFSYLCTPRTTKYTYKTITQVFHEITSTFPDQEILIYRGIDGTRQSLTCRQLQTQATKLAGYLLRKGIKKGDTIAIFGPNTLEWVVGELAIIMAGGIAVHVPFSNTNARDVFEIVSIADCKAFLVDPGKQNEYVDMILKLNTHILEYKNISAFVLLRENEHLTHYDDLPGVLQLEEKTKFEFPTLYPEDAIVIFTTSGSTGKPKMIPNTHFQMINDRRDLSTKTYNDRPFAWMGGSPTRTVYQGQPIVFCDSSIALQGHNTMEIWNVIREEQCTLAFLFPYFLSDLVTHKENYKDSFKLDEVITGGQLIDSLHTKVVCVFTKLLTVAYGMTEEFAVSALSPVTIDGQMQVGDVGKPRPGVEVKIIDGDGNVVRKGENGELCVRRVCGLEKYFKNTGSLDEVLLPGKWFCSGDIAHINENNHITIKGRIKDCIFRGTRKILPSSIEESIKTKNGIRNVTVVGVPDKRLYEEVCVCYVTDPEHEISPTVLKEFCLEKFVGYDAVDGLGDMPKFFLRFSSLPMLINGKINKKQLRLDAIQQLELADQM